MPSESKPLLTTPTEKPNHYSYLKEFRVEQCALFLQHKCSQHRPFSCFNWHFHNQKRRRPVRKRDGTFNYSADNYCSRYDETTGLCPDGDECPFLHRTAGDTERRYHLRYYKTCLCVYDTDGRGYCVKNGPHCAFAHGNHDLRPPVYDIKELQALEIVESANSSTNNNGPNVLDKERNTMSEDPKWQDTAYILAHYKTEACKRPPRLCRQGYACPHFHNIRDKRRNPRIYKYRSTPCPNVKHGDEWGEPTSCENGDTCIYCHTRTEQQFHPEIYKSSKCNDVQQSGYCPRGAFCAFAHLDEEMTIVRDMAVALENGKSLSEILENLNIGKHENSSKNEDDGNQDTSDTDDLTETDTISSNVSDSSLSKAPGAQLSNHQSMRLESLVFSNTQQEEQDARKANLIRKELVAVETDPLLDPIERAERKQSLYEAYSNLSNTNSTNPNGICLSNNNNSLSLSPLSSHFRYNNDAMDSVLGTSTNDLQLDDPTLPLTDFEKCSLKNSISAGLQSSGILCPTAPINIPSSLNEPNTTQLNHFSPVTSPLMNSGFLPSRFQDQIEVMSLFYSSRGSPFLNQTPTLSNITNNNTNTKLNAVNTQFRTASPLYEFSISPSPVVGSSNIISRPALPLVNNFSVTNSAFNSEDKVKNAADLLRRETESLQRRLNITEQQRDEAVAQAKDLKKEVDLLQGSPYLHGLRRISELKNLSLSALKSLQSQLKNDLEEIEKVLYLQTATKCILCEENNRSITLGPCNHFVLCHSCAPTQKLCPYCHTAIATQTSSVSVSS
ncbi:hypothetical protein V9T40_012281 [Parthenolecanium corni]|uniref:RING finger protein unkempt n=1 Tax=Parthenolecanium corni TaxID=536013 RepID=A0AAN9T982_9HEMI